MRQLAVRIMFILVIPALVNAQSLLGYWDFEGHANDVSGYGVPADATLLPGAALVTEAGRNCLDASVEGAIVPGNGINGNEKWDDILGSPFNGQGPGITLSIWVKPNNVDEEWKPIFGMCPSGWGARMLSMASGVLADCQTSNSGWSPVQTGGSGSDWSGGIPGGPSLGWHHLLYTYDYVNNQDRLYVDGMLVAVAGGGESPDWWAASTDEMGLGTDNKGGVYNGYIDDAAIFSGAAYTDDALFLSQGGSVYDVDLNGLIPCYYDLAGDYYDPDCKVNLKDFQYMADNWLISGGYDFADLVVLCENWLINCNLTPDDPACIPW